MTGTCLVCDRPVEVGRDWCSQRCRAAIRRFGAALSPGAPRHQQVAEAVKQRRVAVELGVGMPSVFLTQQPIS